MEDEPDSLAIPGADVSRADKIEWLMKHACCAHETAYSVIVLCDDDIERALHSLREVGLKFKLKGWG